MQKPKKETWVQEVSYRIFIALFCFTLGAIMVCLTALGVAGTVYVVRGLLSL